MSYFPITIPLFLPGVALSVLMGFLLASRGSRPLRTHPAVVWLLIVSVGVIVAATLTPQREALATGAHSSGTCDMRRLGLAPLSIYLSVNETSANVVLFAPLGIAVALLPRGRRKYLCLVAALALPFLIETTQLLLPALARGCQVADVVDNLTGLILGLVVGVTCKAILRWTG